MRVRRQVWALRVAHVPSRDQTVFALSVCHVSLICPHCGRRTDFRPALRKSPVSNPRTLLSAQAARRPVSPAGQSRRRQSSCEQTVTRPPLVPDPILPRPRVWGAGATSLTPSLDSPLRPVTESHLIKRMRSRAVFQKPLAAKTCPPRDGGTSSGSGWSRVQVDKGPAPKLSELRAQDCPKPTPSQPWPHPLPPN